MQEYKTLEINAGKHSLKKGESQKSKIQNGQREGALKRNQKIEKNKKLVSAILRMGIQRHQRQRVQYLLRYQTTMERINQEHGALFGQKRSEKVFLPSKKTHKESKISPTNYRVENQQGENSTRGKNSEMTETQQEPQ
ncbi:hypothetical protein OXYTRIMIC_757 [Oxytricha trifallax]|uniref:Uncharacterized protein n=1 Tax=Oxytricha trifallax TaxID=1172189 RepID=A0A073I0P1_9SPIT|nr:hypothetical protein OXYTRIMIC_757 [Oxytricha trifallax]